MKTCRMILPMACLIGALTALAGADSPANFKSHKDQPAKKEHFQRAATIREADPEPAGEVGFEPRTIPPISGGACQQSGANQTTNASTFNVLDNFHPTASGDVTTVSWAGVYRLGLGTALSNGSPPVGEETFQICFYTHNSTTRLPNGEPNGFAIDGSPAATFNVTATRTQDTATLTIGGVVYTLFNYTVTLPSAFAVDNASCYWIEIRNTTPEFDVTFTVDGYHWRWARATGGDGVSIQKDINTSPSPFVGVNVQTGTAPLDMAFCLNVPFNRATPCQTYPSCTQTAGNCQNFGGGSDNFTSENLPNSAQTADNFRVATAANLTGLCFTGFYDQQALPPNDERFVVNIYTNNTELAPGQTLAFAFPKTLVTSFTLDNDAGVGNQPYFVRAARNNIFNFFNFFEWSATLASPIALQPGCYWIEIVSQSNTGWTWLSNTDFPELGTVANGGDFTLVQKLSGTTYSATDQFFAPDRAFCLSFQINPIGNSCPFGPDAANPTCGTATPLTIGADPTLGFIFLTGGGDLLPPTFESLVDNTNQGGVWYTVEGNGQNITVSTCNTVTSPAGGVPASTNFDSRVAVYCASSCVGPFKAVDVNDDDALCPLNLFPPVVGASTVTFPSVSGQTYYLFVTTLTGTGFHWISASTEQLGVAQPVPCDQIKEPPCVLPPAPAPGPGVFVEDEVCGDIAAGNGDNCLAPYELLYGDRAYGNTSNTGNIRDRDVYRYPDLNSDTVVSLNVKCEAPLQVFGFANGFGFCQTTGNNAGEFLAGNVVFAATFFPNCRNDVSTFDLLMPPGEVYFMVTTPGFDGLSCLVDRNDYQFQVTITQTGACCVQSGNGCIIAARAQCSDQNGQYAGDASVCSPNVCDANGLAVAPVGACCLINGGCSLTTSAGCGSGNAYLGDATTCAADTCPAVQACCFLDGTCSNLIASACTTLGGSSVAGRFCLPNSCADGVSLGSCCNASTGACTSGLTQVQCNDQNGTNWTANGTCVPNVCPQPSGACCNSIDNTCSVQAGQAACASLGGSFVYQGNGTSCSPNPCQTVGGRCCVGSRCAIVSSQAACDALVNGGTAGRFFSTTTATCNSSGNNTAPCCFADYNKTGGITVQDIFDFLSDWFQLSPNANVGGTGTAPEIQDIFDFLAAWFALGC